MFPDVITTLRREPFIGPGLFVYPGKIPGERKSFLLFPLNGGGRFGCDVIHHPVDALHFVDNP